MFQFSSLKDQTLHGILVTDWFLLFMKIKKLSKNVFEKLQIDRNQATVQAATGLPHTVNDKDLKFG